MEALRNPTSRILVKRFHFQCSFISAILAIRHLPAIPAFMHSIIEFNLIEPPYHSILIRFTDALKYAATNTFLVQSIKRVGMP